MTDTRVNETDKLAHYVRRETFDPYDGEKLNPKLERYYMATQWASLMPCCSVGSKTPFE